MFQPLPLFIGLRYVRARQHTFFVSFITWVSLGGVALGVAALIVVLSVMNGLKGELRERLLALSAHARIVDARPAALADDSALAARVRALPGVAGVAPYMDLQALAMHGSEMLPLTLRGIDPQRESAVTDVAPLLVAGSLRDLAGGDNRLIMGDALAEQLGATVGDAVTLLVPIASAEAPPEPRLRVYTVAGIFSAGIQDHDATLALAALDDVRAFAPAAVGAGGLRVRFTDALAAPAFMPAVRAAAGAGYLVRDWTQDNASYFRAIRIEKSMVALILLLIVGVAAFNIVAMLVMVVNDKRTDIAILRTLGAAPGTVLRVFITQGLVIGWCGVAAGVTLGVLVARNVGTIAPFLERVLGFRFFDADVFYITALPSQLQSADVLWISGAALLLTLAATVYPSLRAAATPPADALRYE
ncbi:MAG TPA: lipoprotein-releasing ABC transporter permease subunit [Steroidobacteraceae bacterium]|nr:lipoprotein-releasing ABC transporter permease subunit [Steroidobacteraceae bacterium]